MTRIRKFLPLVRENPSWCHEPSRPVCRHKTKRGRLKRPEWTVSKKVTYPKIKITELVRHEIGLVQQSP